MPTKQSLFIVIKTVMVFSLLLQPCYALDKRELTIKAAYLFRLSLFVEWPKEKLQTPKILFCIAGDEKNIIEIKKSLINRQINQQEIDVIHIKLNDDLSKCHLLYLQESTQLTKDFLKKVQNQPILTIGETENFAEQNGMIYLFKKDNRIKFIINKQSATLAKLTLRAQLLKLAK